MKRWKIGLTALAVMALPMFAWAGLASAQRFSATVGEGETVDSSLYSAGRTVDINGTVHGDIFCAGMNVTINATVRGDVICAGQNVTVKGKVEGDVRLAGQTVSIDADIARNVTVMAQAFSFDADSRAGGDVTAAGDTANIKGQVGRDLLVSSSSFTLNGAVGRHVDATSQKVEMLTNARVDGNFTYTSSSAATIPPGANIRGEVTQKTPEQYERSGGSSIGMYLYFLAAFLLIALVVILFFPQAVRKTVGVAHRHLGKALLAGFIAGIALPVALFALAVTFVGIPLAFMLLIAWVGLTMVSGPIAAYWLGRTLFKRIKNSVAVMLLGATLLFALSILPFVGFIVMLIAYWLGSGAALLTLKRHMPRPDYKA